MESSPARAQIAAGQAGVCCPMFGEGTRSMALRRLLRQGMLLSAVADDDARTAHAGARSHGGLDYRNLHDAMGRCLRVALLLWSGLVAGASWSWLAAGYAGSEAAARAVLALTAADLPIFGIILWGAAFLHAVLAVESVCRWNEAAARRSFVAALVFLACASLIGRLDSLAAGLAGGGALGWDWMVLCAATTATASVSFLLLVAALAAARSAD